MAPIKKRNVTVHMTFGKSNGSIHYANEDERIVPIVHEVAGGFSKKFPDTKLRIVDSPSKGFVSFSKVPQANWDAIFKNKRGKNK